MMKAIETPNADLATLHDAVLLSIDMKWAAGTVTLGVRTPSGPKRITIEQVTRLECPRGHPWGPSVCINYLRFRSPSPRTGFEMEIEMQSGDVLVICGGSIGIDDEMAD